ncbi:MAG: glycosyltransferase family 2 protein [bacterium]|nr:glycosyltransferase family 2 protein [bacterium]
MPFVEDGSPAHALAPIRGLMLFCVALLIFLAVITPLTWIHQAEVGLRTGAIAPLYWLLAILGLYLGLIMFRSAVATFLSYSGFAQAIRRGTARPIRWPRVSVLIPAFQEGENLVASVESILALDYPDLELIVVDDGSTDDTFEIASRFAGRHRNAVVKVFRQPNGGKWSALNLAFQHANAEFVLCVDADSRLSRTALKWLMRQMSDPDINGVCGQVRVRNRQSLVTRLQALEYVLTNASFRMAQSLTGTVLVVSGPIGLYRRAALEDVAFQLLARAATQEPDQFGPISGSTFAEDFETSLWVLALGGRIVYEPRAHAYTRAPDRVSTLLNQRYRWLRGGFQVVEVYRRSMSLLREPGRWALRIWLWTTFLFDLYFVPVFSFVILLALLTSFALAERPQDYVPWVGGYAFAGVLSAIYAIVTQRDRPYLLLFLPLYPLYQTFLIGSAWVIASIDHARRVPMRWS